MTGITMVDGKIRMRKISELKPHPNNSRTHSPEQISLIAGAIRNFGFNVPVLLDEDDTILAGHGRVEAAKLLELATVPTIKASHLDEDQKRAFLIADNKLTERGGWDMERLQVEMVYLHEAGISLEVLGIEPRLEHSVVGEDRTSFLGEIGDRQSRSGPASSSGMVQFNFTFTPERREMIMRALKWEQKRRNLTTVADALAAMCEEILGDAEQAD